MSRSPLKSLAAVAAAVGALTAGCGGSPSPEPTSAATSAPGGAATTGGDLAAAEVATGLTTPWGLVALPDRTLLVSERDTGAILRIRSGESAVVRTLTDVRPGGEGGLMGLALAPDGSEVFAYYTGAVDNRIVAMAWDGTALGEPRPILSGIPKAGVHNGGRLAVGPDGLLYVGTGDASRAELAQDTESLAGKILRLTLDGRPAPGNPYGNEVYSYGHRNVQGLAFDPAGRLWASEFGSTRFDELNLIEAGANYGWPQVEGTGEGDGLINPKVVWSTREASPSGLAYWQDSLWMAGLRGGRLWQIPVTGTETGEPRAHFVETYGRLRSVTVAADGQALLLSASNTDGRGRPQDGDDRILRLTR